MAHREHGSATARAAGRSQEPAGLRAPFIAAAARPTQHTARSTWGATLPQWRRAHNHATAQRTM